MEPLNPKRDSLSTSRAGVLSASIGRMASMTVHRSARLARALVALVVIGSGSWLGTGRSAGCPARGSALAGAVLRLPDGRRPQAGELGQAAVVLPDAGENRVQHAAGRAGKEQREPSLHRALHLVARQPGQARSVPSVERAAGRSARALRGRGAKGRRRGARRGDPELRAALERGGRVADGGRVRLRQRHPQRRRSAAHARQRDQHRRAVDQSRTGRR